MGEATRREADPARQPVHGGRSSDEGERPSVPRAELLVAPAVDVAVDPAEAARDGDEEVTAEARPREQPTGVGLLDQELGQTPTPQDVVTQQAPRGRGAGPVGQLHLSAAVGAVSEVEEASVDERVLTGSQVGESADVLERVAAVGAVGRE